MEKHITFKRIAMLIITLKVLLILYFVINIPIHAGKSWDFNIDLNFLFFIIVGFAAQIIDGTLGMAYGVSCTTLLLYMGVPPAVASAGVHTAEVFTTGVSGLSHLYMKNVDKKLFARLVLPGVIAAMTGAYLISEILDGNFVKPYIAGYLLIMGLLIVIKSFKPIRFNDSIKYVPFLGSFGGLMDAIGGGGWGPIVTSNLVNQGKAPKETIGTVNTAEFFVAFFSTGIFLIFVGVESWKIVLGLIIGGVIAAPLGAFFATRIKPKLLMLSVGILIIITSLFTISKSIGI
ncbi:MAG TPA: sulfite exporter TauE/SafE family protein [Melioribacteraceae bacterium]|nr:sulfite exporter TauE/SafE family protein [Melioribacteraceae bacterium]